MIYQISYQTDKYDKYFQHNKQFTDELEHIVLKDNDINLFLKEFGYYEKFHSLKIHPSVKYAEKAILCSVIRLMFLREFGGMYIDADVYFTENVLTIEEDFEEKYENKNISLINNSLYFLKAIKNSKYIEHLLNLYLNSDFLYLDVTMLRDRQLVKYNNEIAIITHKTLQKYFNHVQITTNG